MPVIPVVAAIGAIGFAAADVAAVGIAAITATTAFEIVGAVGATIGAIGAVTHDKTLSMVGLGIGVVGGVGALASAAGVFGAAGSAPLFGAAPAASTADSAASTGSAFGGVASDAAGGATVAQGAPLTSTYGATSAFDTGDLAGNSVAATAAGTGLTAPTGDAGSAGTIEFMAGSGGSPPPSDLTTLSTTSTSETDPGVALAGPRADGSGLKLPDAATPSLTGLETSATEPVMTGTGVEETAAYGGPPTPPDTIPTGQVTQPWQMPGKWAPGVNDAVGTSSVESPGTLGGILKFANDNKTLTQGLLKFGADFISGAASGEVDAKVAAYNASAAKNQADAKLTAQQTANLAMPKSVATLAPVTGTPAPILRGTGLINNAPRLAPVTGAPA